MTKYIPEYSVPRVLKLFCPFITLSFHTTLQLPKRRRLGEKFTSIKKSFYFKVVLLVRTIHCEKSFVNKNWSAIVARMI